MIPIGEYMTVGNDWIARAMEDWETRIGGVAARYARLPYAWAVQDEDFEEQEISEPWVFRLDRMEYQSRRTGRLQSWQGDIVNRIWQYEDTYGDWALDHATRFVNGVYRSPNWNDWENEALDTFKTIHLANGLVAAGGISQVENVRSLAPQHLRRTHAFFSRYMSHLQAIDWPNLDEWPPPGGRRQFENELEEEAEEELLGSLADRVKRAIRARLQPYIKVGVVMFWALSDLRERFLGMELSRRIINSLNPCIDCEMYEAMGWQRIGILPPPRDGSTVCDGNCYCTVEYKQGRASDIGEFD